MTAVSQLDSASLDEAFTGKVAIVTGAARGIGLAAASNLARHGARVVMVDILEDALKEASATVPSSAYRKCDVGDWSQQVELFDWVSQSVGKIDVLVCNAAINPEIALLQTPDGEKRQSMASQVGYNFLADEMDGSQLRAPSTRVLDLNIQAVLFGLKLGVHHMKDRGGRIVVTGSAASYVPVPSQVLYAASKHAVLGLVRGTAYTESVIQAGISIALVAPWLTMTNMVEGLDAVHHPDTLKSSPDDVARAITHAAAAEDTNGKGFWVQGSEVTEVEGTYNQVAQQLISPANRF